MAVMNFALLAVAAANIEYKTCPPTGFNCRKGKQSNSVCSASTANGGLSEAIGKDSSLPKVDSGKAYICGTTTEADTLWFNMATVFEAKDGNPGDKCKKDSHHSTPYPLSKDGTVIACGKESHSKKEHTKTTTESSSSTKEDHSTGHGKSTKEDSSDSEDSSTDSKKSEKKKKSSGAAAVGVLAVLAAATL